MFRRSSAVEQLTVNQLVVGSIPTAGAKVSKNIADLNMPQGGERLLDTAVHPGLPIQR